MKLRVFSFFTAMALLALASCRNNPTAQLNTTVSDTIAYWTFDGNASDVSGSGHNGSLIGAVAYGPDRFGVANHALVLDGHSSVVVNDTTQLNFAGNNSYTISAWVKTDSLADEGIVCKGPSNDNYPGYRLGTALEFGGHSMVWITNGETNSAFVGTQVVADGKWHLVTAVVTAHVGVVVYVDSIVSSAVTLQSMAPDLDNTGILQIGVDPDGTQHFIGSIDEVLIHGRALDAEEVFASFHEGGWYKH